MPEAIRTARAAGHDTRYFDISGPINPAWAPLDGLIGGVPCTSFSSAGKGAGRADIPRLIEAIRAYADGTDLRDQEWSHPTAPLVIEPIRWAWHLEPTWIAMEQVKEVLPAWEASAEVLREWGYSTWTGLVQAEAYGVPQTRRRAILIAHRDRGVFTPPPTHQEFDPRKKAPRAGTEHRLPYVTMADALGWLPAGVVNTRGQRRTPGGNEFSAAGPSWALTEKARSWKVTGNNSIAGGPIAARESDEPAMTVGSRADLWKLRQSARSNATERAITEPAPTITAGKDYGDRVWVHERPSTTVAGDPRVSAPGWRGRPEDYAPDGEYIGKRSMDEAVRLTIEQALILQSFRPDYPVQGLRSKSFLQVGNSIPPRLAAHILAMATGLPLPDDLR